MTGLKAVCIDCSRPAAQARWWAPVLGYEVRPYEERDLAALASQGIDDPEDDPAVALDPANSHGTTIWMNAVPEEKGGKNRVHLDVYGDVEELVAHGARIVHGHGELPGTDWAVLADPEGNEFCVFRV